MLFSFSKYFFGQDLFDLFKAAADGEDLGDKYWMDFFSA